MEIAVDARAALWYRGTGMGTYTYQLMCGLCAASSGHHYHFLLPGGRSIDCSQRQTTDFFDLSQTKDFFWEEVYAAPLQPLGAAVYHVPHNGIGLPQQLACPGVVTIHDVIPAILPETTGSGYRTLFLKDIPRILEQSAAIVTVSNHSAADISRIFQVPSAKIKVIYQGVEAMYHPLPKEKVKTYLAKHYGITYPYFLYLGGFGGRKNVDALLKAFRIFQQDNQECRLVLAGRNSPGYMQIQKAAAVLGDQVVTLGFLPVAELPIFYNGATAFLYPSLYEGFGLPPLEAMACGTAVLCSNTSSLPEVTGQGALCVAPRDILGFAQGMHRLATESSLREGLCKAGLLRAKEFSWQRASCQLNELYESVVLCKK